MKNMEEKAYDNETAKLRLLYGTGNTAKLAAMRQRLCGLPVEIVGLCDLDVTPPEVEEDGATPLENAKKKALGYYRAFHIPVFSCDSGLYFENVPQELQPGVYVRRVNGVCLSDEEMIRYYSGLAEQFGDLRAQYKNAICLVLDEERIYLAMDEDMASEPFLLTVKPRPQREPGFPLDSLSVDRKTGKHFYDLEDNVLNQAIVKDGFLRFFREVLGGMKSDSIGRGKGNTVPQAGGGGNRSSAVRAISPQTGGEPVSAEH